MDANPSQLTSVASGEDKIMLDRFAEGAGARAGERSEMHEPQRRRNQSRAPVGERSERLAPALIMSVIKSKQT